MSDTQKHTKPNVPNLRFPGFEGEWECNKLSTYLYENKERNRAGEFNKSDVLSVSGDCGIVNQIELLGRSFAGKSVADYHIVRAGNIVYTKSPLKEYPFGIVKYNSGKDGIVSTLYAVYHHRENVNGRFVEHYFTSPQRTNRYFKPIVRIGAKHDMKIGNNEVLDNTVFFPGLEEQNKITELLDLLDQRIAIQNKVIEDLKCVKESITRRLINQKDESSRIVTLGEITEIVSRRNKNKENYPMYSVTNDKGFVPQEELFEDREMVGEDIGVYKIVLKDEIAYNPARINVGSIGQYTGDSPCMISSLYVCIKARKGIDSKWLIQILRSEHLVYYYNLFAEGGVRLYLFYPNFSRIRVTLPPLEQQSRIAAILGQIENKIKLESSILSGYRQTKQALLCKLFV